MIDPASGATAPRPTLADDRPSRAQPADRLDAATREFEAVLLQEMFKVMRETVPEGGLLDGGQGEQMFTSLLDDFIAREAARRAEGGLAAALYRQFIDRVSP